MKKTIRLTESDLKKIIKESVKRALNEANGNYDNIEQIPFDCDIYSVSHENGETIIKVYSYFYQNDDVITLVEFSWLDFTLDEYLNGGEDFVENLEAESKQYLEDFEDPQEAYEAFMSYNAKPLLMSNVNENTPEGFYVDCE